LETKEFLIMLIRVNWKITKNMRMRRRILEPGKEFLIQDNYFEGFLNPEKRVKDSRTWRIQRRFLEPGEYREGF